MSSKNNPKTTTPNASQIDIAETMAEVGAAKLLQQKVNAAYNSQKNITEREAVELVPFMEKLSDRFDAIRKNSGLHSPDAQAAAIAACKTLAKYIPNNMGEARSNVYNALSDLEERFLPKPPAQHKAQGAPTRTH